MKGYGIKAAVAIVAIYAIVAHMEGPADWEAERDQLSELKAAQQDADAAASRAWAGRQVCGNADFSWTDDKTIRCHPRKPLHLAKAKL